VRKGGLCFVSDSACIDFGQCAAHEQMLQKPHFISGVLHNYAPTILWGTMQAHLNDINYHSNCLSFLFVTEKHN
ncbi:hypothetical protein, partial [Pseudomonas savastanoi]